MTVPLPVWYGWPVVDWSGGAAGADVGATTQDEAGEDTTPLVWKIRVTFLGHLFLAASESNALLFREKRIEKASLLFGRKVEILSQKDGGKSASRKRLTAV